MMTSSTYLGFTARVRTERSKSYNGLSRYDIDIIRVSSNRRRGAWTGQASVNTLVLEDAVGQLSD